MARINQTEIEALWLTGTLGASDGPVASLVILTDEERYSIPIVLGELVIREDDTLITLKHTGVVERRRRQQ